MDDDDDFQLFSDPGVVPDRGPKVYHPIINPYKAYGDSRLELFDIQISKMNQSQKPFFKIWTDDSKGNEVIYELLGEAANIPIGESLPLIGPSKPCKICSYYINVWFGDLSWWFGVEHNRFRRTSGNPDVWLSKETKEPVEWNTPMTRVAFNEIGSEATIRFELIRNAVLARLEFQFFSEEKVEVEIKDGVISATHNGNEETKRLVRQFGAKNMHLSQKRKANDYLLDLTKQTIRLDRSVFAVPMKGELNVSVEITYDVNATSTVVQKKIKSTVSFKVPEDMEPNFLTSEEQFFPNFDDEGEESPKLRVKIFWHDPCGEHE